MPADLNDLKALGEDLGGCLQRHPDAVRSNPDITSEIVKIRDKVFARYDELKTRGENGESSDSG